VLDYPREAPAFCAEAEARAITPDVRITPAREEQLKERLGREHTSYLDFHFIAVELATMPYSHWRDSDNIVARINLPNMRHEQHERVESAEPETLTRWFGQALTADNLDEVLHGGCGR